MSMKGKVVLITGATSGIGLHTAKVLSKKGATIVLTTRDKANGKAARKEIIEFSRNRHIEVLHCDLSSLASVRKCCDEFKKKHGRLDVLINNAGIMPTKYEVSGEGIELTWATNYLAPFLMTNLLLPTLKASAPSRIISTTSGLHSGTIHFDDLEHKNRKFRGFKVYAHSKLAMILFTRYLAKELKDDNIAVNTMNPGMTRTKLGRNNNFISSAIFWLMAKPLEEGAEPLIYLASSKEGGIKSGEYWDKKQVKKSSDESYDMKTAKRLWKVSEEYVMEYLE